MESMAVIPEDDYDQLYGGRRTINSVEKRYIERMDNRSFTDVKDAWFVDCGIKYEGGDHNYFGPRSPRAETVSALADGDVCRILLYPLAL